MRPSARLAVLAATLLSACAGGGEAELRPPPVRKVQVIGGLEVAVLWSAERATVRVVAPAGSAPAPPPALLAAAIEGATGCAVDRAGLVATEAGVEARVDCGRRPLVET